MLLIIISLPDRQTLWIQGIFFNVPLLHLITNISPIECFGYDHHRSTGSILIPFSVQIALYVFPLLWAALLIVSLLKLGFASVRSISII